MNNSKTFEHLQQQKGDKIANNIQPFGAIFIYIYSNNKRERKYLQITFHRWGGNRDLLMRD